VFHRLSAARGKGAPALPADEVEDPTPKPVKSKKRQGSAPPKADGDSAGATEPQDTVSDDDAAARKSKKKVRRLTSSVNLSAASVLPCVRVFLTPRARCVRCLNCGGCCGQASKRAARNGAASPIAASASASASASVDGVAAAVGTETGDALAVKPPPVRRRSKKLLEGCAGLVMDESRWRKKQGISDATKVCCVCGCVVAQLALLLVSCAHQAMYAVMVMRCGRT
jgi:hypothetical protein